MQTLSKIGSIFTFLSNYLTVIMVHFNHAFMMHTNLNEQFIIKYYHIDHASQALQAILDPA